MDILILLVVRRLHPGQNVSIHITSYSRYDLPADGAETENPHAVVQDLSGSLVQG